MLVSCSNLSQKKEEFNTNQIEKLDSKIEIIKNELKANKLATLEKSLDMPLKKRYILNSIKNIDFSKVDIYSSKPIVNGDKGRNLIGIRRGEEVFYFDLQYKYSKGEWNIIDFKESR